MIFFLFRYKDDSLKSFTRENRGEGTRIKISLSTKIPRGWENFLRHGANKTALFELIAKSISGMPVPGKTICATLEENVITNIPNFEDPNLSPCNHEEADSRLFVHVASAVQQGHSKVLIRTCDTDVLVIAITCVPKISGLEELWLHFGMGKHAKFIAAHEIANVLGES